MRWIILACIDKELTRATLHEGVILFGVPGVIPPVIRPLLAHTARSLGRLPSAAAKNADSAAFS